MNADIFRWGFYYYKLACSPSEDEMFSPPKQIQNVKFITLFSQCVTSFVMADIVIDKSENDLHTTEYQNID